MHNRGRLGSRKSCVFVCCLLVLLLTACSDTEPVSKKQTLSVGSTQAYTQTRAFILQHLMGTDGGIHTNLLTGQSSGDITRGYDVLAESQGLLMEYAVQVRDQALFEQVWKYVQSRMLLQNGLIAWRVVNAQPADSNATVDDLRICKALRLGADTFHDKDDLKAANQISDALYHYCREDSFLLSGNAKGSPPVLSSYLDLSAIQTNAETDKRWKDVYLQTKSLLSSARVSNEFPLYRETYRPSSHTFAEQDSYDMVASLLAFYDQSQNGTTDEKACAWLKSACDGSGLFASYNKYGVPVSSVQSTAIYALTMLVAREQNDRALYQSAYAKMLAFQVTDTNNILYGGFGNAATGEAYSFDNLLALLALTPSST